MKNFLFLFPLLFAGTLTAQQAGIIASEFQLSGILKDDRIAWASQGANIFIDKSTGELRGYLAVDDFRLSGGPADFVEGLEKGKGKYVEFATRLPVAIVLENRNQSVSVRAEMAIRYNGLEVVTPFNFTILALPQRGFSILGQGSMAHSGLEIEGLRELDDELFIIWSIIGK